MTIYNERHNPLAKAVVVLVWSDGTVTTGTTEKTGTFTVTHRNIDVGVTSLDVNVVDVTMAGYVYDSADNDVTLPITVTKPS